MTGFITSSDFIQGMRRAYMVADHVPCPAGASPEFRAGFQSWRDRQSRLPPTSIDGQIFRSMATAAFERGLHHAGSADGDAWWLAGRAGDWTEARAAAFLTNHAAQDLVPACSLWGIEIPCR